MQNVKRDPEFRDPFLHFAFESKRVLPRKKMPAIEIAGLCLPLKPQKERR
jgi:hypothetical protein